MRCFAVFQQQHEPGDSLRSGRTVSPLGVPQCWTPGHGVCAGAPGIGRGNNGPGWRTGRRLPYLGGIRFTGNFRLPHGPASKPFLEVRVRQHPHNGHHPKFRGNLRTGIGGWRAIVAGEPRCGRVHVLFGAGHLVATAAPNHHASGVLNGANADCGRRPAHRPGPGSGGTTGSSGRRRPHRRIRNPDSNGGPRAKDRRRLATLVAPHWHWRRMRGSRAVRNLRIPAGD